MLEVLCAAAVVALQAVEALGRELAHASKSASDVTSDERAVKLV